MSNTKFRVDRLSSSQSADLVKALEHQHDNVIKDELPRAFRAFGYGSALKDAASQFSFSLRRKKAEIPVDDLVADVEDFGMLAAVADTTNARLPALRLGRKTVPVLPPKGYLTTLPETELFSPKAESILWEIASAKMKEDALVFRPASMLRRTFFNRLERFLAVRIAGIRWARNNVGDGTLSFQIEPATRAAGASSGGGGASGGSRPGYASAQEWTIHTSGIGHSIYYGGTHGIRSHPIYLNAPTTPVNVFLPMGTILLAADAGPNGDYVWDRSVIDVPSATPIYYTRAF